jgi:hypothetical protein
MASVMTKLLAQLKRQTSYIGLKQQIILLVRWQPQQGFLPLSD